MKNIILLSFATGLMTLSGCGSSSSTSRAPTTTAPTTDTSTSATWTNTEMQSLVASNCAISGCHAGSHSPDYRNISESQMKADTEAKSEVAEGSMPRGSSFTSEQKAIFANFYN